MAYVRLLLILNLLLIAGCCLKPDLPCIPGL